MVIRIDFDGVYQTSYRRLHVHKGSAHFDFYTSSGVSGFVGWPCTGYASASAPNLQPGVAGTAKGYSMVTGGAYWFVSTQGAVYIAAVSTAGVYSWGCIINAILDKVGSWADGFGATGISDLFNNLAYTSPGYAQVYYNGGWSSNGLAAGG